MNTHCAKKGTIDSSPTHASSFTIPNSKMAIFRMFFRRSFFTQWRHFYGSFRTRVTPVGCITTFHSNSSFSARLAGRISGTGTIRLQKDQKCAVRRKKMDCIGTSQNSRLLLEQSNLELTLFSNVTIVLVWKSMVESWYVFSTDGCPDGWIVLPGVTGHIFIYCCCLQQMKICKCIEFVQ